MSNRRLSPFSPAFGPALSPAGEAGLLADTLGPGGEAGLLAAARVSAHRRMTRWPRRALSPSVRVLMWAMRAYVVLMLAVVALQIVRLV